MNQQKTFHNLQFLLLIFLLAILISLFTAKKLFSQCNDYCVYLNGSTQYVTAPHSSSFQTIVTNNRVTIEAWLKPVSYTTPWFNVVDKQNSFFLEYLSWSNCFQFGAGSTYYTVYYPFQFNVWTHIALVFNGSQCLLYVNGVYNNSSTTHSGTISSTSNNLYIGYGISFDPDWYNGYTDEVRFWNVVRTPSEISANYNQPINTPQTGLVANYRFLEGSGNSTADVSGNNNTGSLISNPTWATGYFQGGGAPPNAPSLVYPVNNTTDMPLNFTFIWNKSAGASTYRIQVASDSLFSSLIMNDSTVTDTTKYISGLSYSANYFWRVNAKNTCGTSNYSIVWKFTTGSPPPLPSTPNLVSPANNALNQPFTINFIWNKVQYAQTYRLLISTDSLFGLVFYNDSTITDSTKQVSGFVSETRYFWKVCAKNATGTGPYSTVWAFNTMAIPIPDVPVLSSPADSSVDVPQPVSLKWYKVSGAVSYRVQLSTDSLFNNLIVNDSTVTDSLKSVSGLSNSTKYFWRVKAKNSYVWGPYSQVWMFNTAAVQLTCDKALSFNGADQYMEVPHSSSFGSIVASNRLTLEAWVKPNWTSQWFTITDKLGSFDFEYQKMQNRFMLKIGWTFYTIPYDQLQFNTWTHVAITFNGSQCFLYVNGVYINSSTVENSSIFNNTNPLNIGYGPTGNTDWYSGIIDEVRIWNYVRSSGEISANYNVSITTPQSGLVANYRFIEGSGTTTADWSGNNNNGSLINNPNWVEGICGANAPPYAPQLSSPANNLTNQPLYPQLKWLKCQCVTSYRVQVATDVFFTNIIVNDSNTVDTFKTLTNLNSLTTYFWRVNAKNNMGTSSYSPVWKFTTEQLTLHTGLVAYYPFTGNALDSSGYNNHGTINGNVTLTTDRYNNPNSAYMFNGGYITTGNNLFPAQNNPRTLIAWFKMLNSSYMQNIWGYGPNNNSGCRNYLYYNSGRLGIECLISTKYFYWTPDTLWHILVAVYPPNETSTNKFLIYFDGALQSTIEEYNSTLNTEITNPAIGRLDCAGAYYFNGKIDDVMLYNRALSTSEILELYQHPLPVTLTYFNSAVNKNNVMLSWCTAQEINNKGFDILRLSLKADWKTIGFVQGNGTTGKPVNYSFTDSKLATGTYKYKLKQTDYNGNFEYFELPNDVNVGIPDKPGITQNYPNPSNPKSIIDYQISVKGLVTIKIYDILGREIKTLVNEQKEAGYYSVEFDGTDIATGIYFYAITAGDFRSTKKMILLK